MAGAGFGIAGAIATSSTSAARPIGANGRLTVAVIGCGQMGTSHVRTLAGREDIDLAYTCDIDEARAGKAADRAKSAGKAPRVVQDLRRVLDDTAVDAVWIATPDHWHGPAAILACLAGKHVYVEKPCSHNIREGRLMVEAARKHSRVMQVGMQSRSSPTIREAIQLLRDGAIGDVLVAKAWNSQKRKEIGHASPVEPPPGLDYDLWIGPAPMVPYQSNRLHYNWHWWFAFGSGDMGNDGVHELDIARWGLGVEAPPFTVTALGGKYAFDDDQEFPDTQYVAFEFPGDGRVGQKRQLIYEQRIWSPYPEQGFENGNAFYGTKGMMLLSKGDGWSIPGGRSRKGAASVPENHQDFLDSIREGRRSSADIEIGHSSASLAHLGNIATRVGRTLHYEPQFEQIPSDPEANRLVRRDYRDGHWAIPRGA